MRCWRGCRTPRSHLVAKSMAPVKTDRGMEIVPTITLADCPQLDLIMVPGGPGQQDLMEDQAVLEFLQQQARGAKYITSVCTGSLVLGAAGLLKGKRATSHWAAIDHLKLSGRHSGERARGDATATSSPAQASPPASISRWRWRRDPRRRGGGAADPAADRVRPGAAVQHRLAEDRAGRDDRAAAQPRRGAERAAPRGRGPRRQEARRAAKFVRRVRNRSSECPFRPSSITA